MAPQRRQQPGSRRAAATAAALLLGCLAALPTAAAAADGQADEYVVVFKRGFDAAKVKALCSTGAGGGRWAGLCRRRFSAVLNGFVGAWGGARGARAGMTSGNSQQIKGS